MTTDSSPLAFWATHLASWGIPEHILAAAPQSPWIHPVQSFRPDGDLHVETPSRLRALAALERVQGTGPSVLDVGCGGGRAAFGLTPPATSVIGVDHQQAMLDVFAEEASKRGVRCTTVLGDWPDIASSTPRADVVTCHHVLYNVGSLSPFITALHEHTRRRVVIELPWQHPLSVLSGLWKEFWDLDRPTSPTAQDATDAIASLGVDARLERFEVASRAGAVTDQDVEFTRIRLCLPASRDSEIRRYLETHPTTGRALATIWWDV